MKKILITPVLLFVAAAAFAQASNVVLSELKVTPLINAISPEQNGFFIELKVSDPAGLRQLEVTVENDDVTKSMTDLLMVQQKNGKVELTLDKYVVPFEGKDIRFFLKARDQLKSPQQKVTIRGVDNGSRITHALVYNQLN